VRVLHAQSKDQPLPKIVQKDGRYGLFVDGAPYLMLGAQVNNSSACRRWCSGWRLSRSPQGRAAGCGDPGIDPRKGPEGSGL